MGPTRGQQEPGGPHVGHMNYLGSDTWDSEYTVNNGTVYRGAHTNVTLTARFMGPTWGPPGDDKT